MRSLYSFSQLGPKTKKAETRLGALEPRLGVWNSVVGLQFPVRYLVVAVVVFVLFFVSWWFGSGLGLKP